ncbi:MAG: hypothetical protein JXR46_08395 [Calditrichaceae bacterium]|nr:hypothetical protein [Calditrichaceae bacterium]MBN2709050.1 hypothetical protein [Calditrichaceae bacterium]RQV97008.1 MAG: DUF2884 family protein [Calditrichota bacterium]
MRIAIAFVLSLFILSSAVYGVDYKKKKKHQHKEFMEMLDNANIDIDDQSIFLYPKDHKDTVVEINEDHELIIDGEEIELDDNQQELVSEFYNDFFEIIDRAKEIGLQGAKVGLKGAGIGLAALVSVLKLLDEDYDSEDLEKEMEEKTKELEEKAKALEEEAEELEALAEKLEKTAQRMNKEIEEIRETEIFDEEE